MPNVAIDTAEFSGVTPGVANLKDATLWLYPFRPYGSPQLVTEDKVVVKTVGGVASVFLPQTPAGNGVYVEIRGVRLPSDARKFIVAIPAGDCNLFDLAHLDPDTLDPEADPEAAWWVAVDDMVQSGAVDGSGHLILSQRDGDTIDAGYVIGPGNSDANVAGYVAGSGPTAAAVAAKIATGITGKVSKGELVHNVKDYGATGDGTTDDTVAIRNALDYIGTLPSGGVLFFPAGTYRVTRIYHPDSTGGAGIWTANKTIFKVADKTTLRGAGRGATTISIEFDNLTASASATSMLVFGTGDDFTAEDIHFHGNYNPGTWAFFPTNNDNGCIGPLRATNFRQSIRDCKFSNLPGFYVGTMVTYSASFTGNVVDHCANGYNVNGSTTLVSGNSFYYSEGVEAAGALATSSIPTGRIQVVNNSFYECSIAASLGGNNGTTTDHDSFGYLFNSNTVHNLATTAAACVVIANNARSFAVNGNTFRGQYQAGVSVTLASQPVSTTPRDGLISGNMFDHTLDSASTIGYAVTWGHADGRIMVSNNAMSMGPGQTAMLSAGASPGEAIVASNWISARYALTQTSTTTAKTTWAPSNLFIPSDASPRFSITSGAALTESTYIPGANRVSIMGTTDYPEFVSRLRGAGTETNDAIALHKRSYLGKYEWGPTAGGATDTSLERFAMGVLGVGATHCFRTGRDTTANRPSAVTAGAGATFYDTTLGKLITSNGTVWDDGTLATGKLLGRSTAGTGLPEAITIGSGLSLVSGTLTASGGGGGSSTGANFLPTGSQANAPRWAINSAAHAAPTSGRLALHAIWLEAGTTVTNISLTSGTTAGSGLTHAWFALYDSSRALLGVTSDDTAATWVASTTKTLALSSAVAITTSAMYYIGVVVVGTTIPTFTGSAQPAFGINALTPATNGASTTGLTTPGTAPNPAASIAATTISGWAWAYTT